MSASISHYVLKVSSRCDLACDHCYVYEHADQSWRRKPKALAERTAAQAARRISAHAEAHLLDAVHVVLHGGEPLLLGPDRLRRVADALLSHIAPVTRLDLRIHTNGVLLDEEMCALLANYGVRVGVSLDGDRIANDRHRRFSDGRSSYSQVRRALSLLRKPEYRHLYTGILCTVDLQNDPIAVYEALLAEAPPRVDFLLPHATWERPPPRPSGSRTPYASWLGRIHTRWLADGCRVPIRFFDSMLAAWAGCPSGSEAVGLDPVDLLVIETDGTWEQADSLKTAFDGAPMTGFSVFTHSVDEAAAHPDVAARQAGMAALCQICRECPIVRACGGGLYAHRYRSGSFNNPSVYCEDLKVLIPRITTRPKSVPIPPVSAIDPAACHSLPDRAFDLLSAGPGDSLAMASLADTQWSVTRALVAAVASGIDAENGDLKQAASEGWALLVALDSDQPQAVRDVLTYPYVREWAMRCLSPATSADPDLDRAHLAALAAAAALRAGVEAELPLPIRTGSVYLPTVGAFAVEPGPGRTTVARVSSSSLSFRTGSRGFQRIRRITAAGMSVTVDDIDPFRDCQAWPVARRLSDTDWETWSVALPTAARQLSAELPAYASVIGTGLRSVVPMRSDGVPGQLRSGTSRQAFGAVALALPDDSAALSAMILHEMQHVKLTALCDMYDLFDRADGRSFSIPWRSDPRPFEGALHGAYAHLAIADLWRVRARREPNGAARSRFLMYRSWVEQAIELLLAAGTLMPVGQRFVNGMRATVEAWADDR
jgi:uncharacterized protein